MDAKLFKKPSIAFGRKVPITTKENKDRLPAAQPPTPIRKHNCVSSEPARSMSVSSSDDGKSANSKSMQVHAVDLSSWEVKAKRTMRDFCISNGLDMNILFPDEGKKKSVASKAGTAQIKVQNASKLLPTFKALDTLLTEKDFPPADVIELLKPLGDSFFVKRCANYWHLLAKAAITAQDYELSVELLERGTKCGAEPLMEMQRAYGSICRRLVVKLNELKGQIPNAFMPEDVQNGTMEEEVELEHVGGEQDEGEGENAATEEEEGEDDILNRTMDADDFGASADGAEASETNDVVNTGKSNETPREPMTSIENDIIDRKTEPNFVEEVGAEFPTVEEGGHVEQGHFDDVPEFGENELEAVPDKDQQGDGGRVNNDAIREQEDGGHDQGDGDQATNDAVNMMADGLEKANLNGDSTRDGSPVDQLPELPTASMKTPHTGRRTGQRKSSLDQGAVFKSSATKLLVVENKSSKKQKGRGDMPAYSVTPVRRSTRKAGGYDKWMTYRTTTTTIDSPSEFPELNKENAKFVKNPYLPSDEDDSD